VFVCNFWFVPGEYIIRLKQKTYHSARVQQRPGGQLGDHWKQESPPDTEKSPGVVNGLESGVTRLRLEEYFDRFNILRIYKEKEMADFRKWILALAVLALVFTFTGVASAQAGGVSGEGTALTCQAGTAVPPQLRT